MVLLFRENWMNQRQNWLVFRVAATGCNHKNLQMFNTSRPLLIWFEAAMLASCERFRQELASKVR